MRLGLRPLAMALGFVLFFQTAFALPAIDEKRAEKLKTETIWVGSHKVLAEIADTPDARERGLMFRKSMPSDSGMLFVFEMSEPMAFWMKNTLIPLSIGFFDSDGKLIHIEEMVPAVVGEARPKTYPSGGPALYALEMNKGWFAKHKVKLGERLKRNSSKVQRK